MNGRSDTISKIPISELEQMLLDPDVPDSALRPYLMIDGGGGDAYRPQVRVNPSRVEGPGPAEGIRPQAAFILGPLNEIARWRRQQRYRSKIKGWRGLRIVEEGDSWFQFPFLLDDVIDQLFDEYAIFSLSAAGDLLSDMMRQNELLGAVASEKPHFVFLSGGGNDLLGSGRLTRYIEPFEPGRPAEAYLGAKFDSILKSVIADYRRILSQLRNAHPKVRIFFHSYDRAIPKGGRWLGQPMTQAGIRDAELQKAIVAAILEKFHNALLALTNEPGLASVARVVDCRGQVHDDRWWDELHPTDEGFADVAGQFREILQQEDVPQPVADFAAEFAIAFEILSPEVQAVLKLDETHNDNVLYREIGRRMTLAGLPGGGIEQSAATVAASSLEGTIDDFLLLGRRLMARLHRELFDLLCGKGDADKNDRAALREALGLGEAALAASLVTLLTGGAFALPAAVATPVAALLMRRFFSATWEETCSVWSEKQLSPAQFAPVAASSPELPSSGEVPMTTNETQYCVCITPETLPPADIERLKGHKAALLREAKWDPGVVIKVRFLEGSPKLRKRVRHYAEQWIGEKMANLTFSWIDRGKADIRIAFRQGKGSWSYLGTVCRQITDQSEPTMNYGWLTDQSTEDEIKRVVLHEFGHALGLIHEHQNPEGGIVWNEVAVINDLSGPPNYWKMDQIRTNVLNHYDADAVIASKLDPKSIMMYPIPSAWTVGGFSTSLNVDLTDMDRKIIRQAYP